MGVEEIEDPRRPVGADAKQMAAAVDRPELDDAGAHARRAVDRGLASGQADVDVEGRRSDGRREGNGNGNGGAAAR